MGYEELKDSLRGVAFTNPTPFSEDREDVLHDELARNVEWMVDRGAGVVIPCGNTGEYYSLSMDERAEVVATTVEAAGDATVVGGLGGSTKSVLHLLSRYEAAGVDAVMVMHPVHTYVHHEGIRRYYERILEATDLGVVLYKRGPELTADHLAALAEYDNVVAVKYADNDVKAFSQAVSDVEGDVVWSNGIAERFAPSFAIEGAEAFTTGIGNFVPEQVLALQDALRDEDWEEARRVRDLLRPYEDLREETGRGDSDVAAANNVPAVKYGQELAGLYGGPVREPLVDLSEADRERAEAYYDRIVSEV
ncbi:dihydrodipicolinate synthase family protein [Halomarina pelagica]|uniref:dihydrodipicolinate synthase family protein n=1 Tax=Halomarina pelagica TaxID=2961599 RepID=UPI0020C4672C|nr:dihydrodipicolinate synthase family protein [Halomarina sp. BND7]